MSTNRSDGNYREDMGEFLELFLACLVTIIGTCRRCAIESPPRARNSVNVSIPSSDNVQISGSDSKS